MSLGKEWAGYWTVQSIADDVWLAFAVYCFWHGHNTTGWVFVVLTALNSFGRSWKREKSETVGN